jgi:hypothetical protein
VLEKAGFAPDFIDRRQVVPPQPLTAGNVVQAAEYQLDERDFGRANVIASAETVCDENTRKSPAITLIRREAGLSPKTPGN